MSDKITHIGQLKPDQKNPRKHNPRNIGVVVDSLQQVGFARSIVIDEDGVILAGNGAIEAAGIAGIEKVVEVEGDGNTIIAVRRRGLSDESKRKLKYFDNRSAELADWDPAVIVSDLELGLDLSGMWTPEELSVMLEGAADSLLGGDGSPRDAEPKIDQADQLRQKYGVESGQVWQLGEHHRIICGDCTDAVIVERVMRGERARALITDPPYGMRLDTDYTQMSDWFNKQVGGKYDGFRRKAAGSKSKEYRPVKGDDKPFDASFLFGFYGDAEEVFLWGADYYSDTIPNVKQGGWLVWDKRLDEDLDKMFGSAFELCWTKKPHKRDIIRERWVGYFGTEKQDTKGRVHPTQKPLGVMNFLLTRHTKEGWIIADPFLGSGTTLVACENLGRKCRGIEIDPGYIGVCLQRFVDATGKEPVCLSEH